MTLGAPFKKYKTIDYRPGMVIPTEDTRAATGYVKLIEKWEVDESCERWEVECPASRTTFTTVVMTIMH